MRGKTVLITGASSDIGLAAARRLGQQGAALIMVSRDRARGAAAQDEVAKVAVSPAPTFLAADLSSQHAIRALADDLHARFTRLDVLINNAGTASRRRELTVDGIERTLATNHLGPFLLTGPVLDLLLAAPAGRIVTVTSESHNGRLDFDNLQGERHYNFFDAYARSKLTNILFTYELARRLKATSVIANCYTPGPTATNFGRGAGGLMGLMSGLVRVMALTPLGSSAAEGPPGCLPGVLVRGGRSVGIVLHAVAPRAEQADHLRRRRGSAALERKRKAGSPSRR